MYERVLSEPRTSPVENGEFIEGSWDRAFSSVNFLDIKRPYPWPLPVWIREGRLKERESFIVQNSRYHLDAFIANLKYFRIVQLVLYDKENGRRFRFRKILPLSGWKMPKNLYGESIESRSFGFYFRIHNWLDTGAIRVDLDIAARGKRPSFTAHLAFDTVSRPLVTAVRQEGLPFYAYKVSCPVSGDMVWGGRHIVFKSGETTGFFRDSKGFYPYLFSDIWCQAAGFSENGQRCGFSLGDQHLRTSGEHNENAFWADGKMTPLPPVQITMPEGVHESWVIQDMEGMVDLSFTPKVPAHSAFNLMIFNADHYTPLGHFTGFLVNSEKERIPLRNLWGLGEKLSLRV